METIILFTVFIIQAFCSGFYMCLAMDEARGTDPIAYGGAMAILLAGIPLGLLAVGLLLAYKVLEYFQLIYFFKHVVFRVPLDYENIHLCRELLTTWTDETRYSKWYNLRGRIIYHLSLWTYYKYMVWLANNK